MRVIDPKPKNSRVVDVSPQNSAVLEVKSRNILVFRETKVYEYDANIRAGQPMGLLLALTYPTTVLE